MDSVERAINELDKSIEGLKGCVEKNLTELSQQKCTISKQEKMINSFKEHNVALERDIVSHKERHEREARIHEDEKEALYGSIRDLEELNDEYIERLKEHSDVNLSDEKDPCPHCDGTGIKSGHGNIPCLKCYGSGEHNE